MRSSLIIPFLICVTLQIAGGVAVRNLELCSFPESAYCIRKISDGYIAVKFQDNFYNNTRFSWPDMDLINMMHARIVDSDKIRTIDFSSNCHWIFSWRMALQWTARSLRLIRFAPGCLDWARDSGYCVNVPHQWRRWIHVENARLCSENEESKFSEGFEDSGSSELGIEDHDLTDTRVARNLLQHNTNSGTNFENEIESPDGGFGYANDDEVAETSEEFNHYEVSPDNEIESFENKSPDRLTVVYKGHHNDPYQQIDSHTLHAQLEQVRRNYEAQIEVLRHQLDVCTSTVHALGLRTSKTDKSSVYRGRGIRSLTDSMKTELHEIQDGIADLARRVDHLLA